MELNAHVLHELAAWGSQLRGFTRSHAIYGLTLAQGYIEGTDDGSGGRIEGIGWRDERTLLLLAMEIAWLIWLDDRFDQRAVDVGPEIDWQALLTAGGAAANTPEFHSYEILRAHFARAARDEAAYLYWEAETLPLFRAYRQAALVSQKARPWTYAEHLHNGELGVGVRHCVAAISLLYGFELHVRRAGSFVFQRTLRTLCLAMRLQNDLASAAKERVEGDRANAVLLMEAYLPRAQARAFVAAEQQGFERVLMQDLDAMDPDDAFARIARVMLAATGRLYAMARARYIAESAASVRSS